MMEQEEQEFTLDEDVPSSMHDGIFWSSTGSSRAETLDRAVNTNNHGALALSRYIPKEYLKTKGSKISQPFWKRILCDSRLRNICTLILGFLFLGIVATIVAIYYYVPGAIQRRLDEYSAGESWPAMDFSSMQEHCILFNLTYQVPLTNFVETTVEFEGPMTFSTSNSVVASLRLPKITYGAGKKYVLDKTLQIDLLDNHKFVLLWKRWISRSFNAFPPASILEPTMWDCRVNVTITMLGFVWRNLELRKTLEWNGGLSRGVPPISLKLRDWGLGGSPLAPQARMKISYFHPWTKRFNLGDFEVSIYSLLRMNRTLSVPVRILKIELPNFYYSPGNNLIDVESRFLIKEPNVVPAYAQLGSNFLRNETSVLLLREFKSYVNGRPVTWLNEVFTYLSFVIRLERPRTFLEMARKRMDKVSTQFMASVENVDDFSPLRWSNLNVNIARLRNETWLGRLYDSDIRAISKLERRPALLPSQ